MSSFELNQALFRALQDITTNPYQVIDAESTPKRASVALVIRINPSYTHWPAPGNGRPSSLAEFLETDWVQHGEPEVLFIKRAARKGDRWTSHVALPGGRRDPDDADDEAAAVRETIEEVGLDLRAHSLSCGNLPQRIVTTHWGKKPLLILCPYVYLLTTHDTPPLKLQPTEVAATHWVPIRSLLSETSRSVVYEDVSSRMANQETGVKKWMLSMILGKMMFAAINLAPSESLHSRESPALDERKTQDNRYARPTIWSGLATFGKRIYHSQFLGHYPAHPPEQPLLLWGLTLGVIADFLDLLPPHNALTLWSYPTFTPLDVRLAIALMTYRFKNRKRAELQSGTTLPGDALDEDSRRRAFGGVSESMVLVERPDETGFHGLGTGIASGENKSKKAAVSTMLDGCVERLAALLLPEITNRARYYDIVRRAVATALFLRFGALSMAAFVAWRRWRYK